MEAGGWTNFFSAEVDATAALTGLVIVAMSINLKRILEFPTLVTRAAETLLILVGALVVSSLLLVPATTRASGVAVTAVAAIVWALPAIAQIRGSRVSEADYRDRPLLRFLFTQAATLPMLIGGILLVSSQEAGYYGIVVSVLLALVAGVVNTWVLLVEILR